MVNLLPYYSLVFQVKFQSETLDQNLFFADELPFVCQSAGKLKPLQNKKGRKKILAAPKMVSFSQLPAEKKDTIFGAARNCFGPSYFVMALHVLWRKLTLKLSDILYE